MTQFTSLNLYRFLSISCSLKTSRTPKKKLKGKQFPSRLQTLSLTKPKQYKINGHKVRLLQLNNASVLILVEENPFTYQTLPSFHYIQRNPSNIFTQRKDSWTDHLKITLVLNWFFFKLRFFYLCTLVDCNGF